MNQEIRIYKQFDTDLIALSTAGYQLSKMFKEALIGYANGHPVKFEIGPLPYFDLNDKKSIHMRVSITDKKTIHVLKNIKHGYRNTFCKCVLRNSLSGMNPNLFFSDSEMFEQYQGCMENTVLAKTGNISTSENILFSSVMSTEHSVDIKPVFAQQAAIVEPLLNVPAESVSYTTPTSVASATTEVVQVTTIAKSEAADVDDNDILDMFDGL